MKISNKNMTNYRVLDLRMLRISDLWLQLLNQDIALCKQELHRKPVLNLKIKIILSVRSKKICVHKMYEKGINSLYDPWYTLDLSPK